MIAFISCSITACCAGGSGVVLIRWARTVASRRPAARASRATRPADGVDKRPDRSDGRSTRLATRRLRPWIPRLALAAALFFALAATARPAHANGRFPAAQHALVGPGAAAARLVLRATFGFAVRAAPGGR